MNIPISKLVSIVRFNKIIVVFAHNICSSMFLVKPFLILRMFLIISVALDAIFTYQNSLYIKVHGDLS